MCVSFICRSKEFLGWWLEACDPLGAQSSVGKLTATGACYVALAGLQFAIHTGWSQTHYVTQAGLELLAILQPQPPDAAIIGMCYQPGLVGVAWE